ncbi:hypothetical protein SEA_CARON_70 [Microbacterium phage Caron]|uniref:Uncharacterized protein n=1 Tax=Microbacterium phage Caron TaxID=3028494 RepID=A0AAE9ZNW6_9CAUD|nr:hypothetical protein SEA_CARON_70 [Microbacterium phage Caron]
MSAASAARSGVRRFGDLPRRDQIAVYLRNDTERLERARSGFIRDPRQRGSAWAFAPEHAAQRVAHYERKVAALLDELADLTLEALGGPEPSLDDLHVEAIIAERDALRRTLDAVEAARSGHPACDRHAPSSAVSCGWKRAIQDIDLALSERPAP